MAAARLAPRVIIAFDAYKDRQRDPDCAAATAELDYQLKSMSVRETKQYYKCVRELRAAMAAAAERTEWAPTE